MKTHLLFVAIALALTSLALAAETELKDQKDKISYGIGLDIGSTLKRQKIHVDPQNERELESLLDTVTALMSQHVRESRPSSGVIPSLVWPPEISEREAEVLQLIADGGTAGSVALALHLSIHTVRSHIRNARRKLKSATARGRSERTPRRGRAARRETASP